MSKSTVPVLHSLTLTGYDTTDFPGAPARKNAVIEALRSTFLSAEFLATVSSYLPADLPANVKAVDSARVVNTLLTAFGADGDRYTITDPKAEEKARKLADLTAKFSELGLSGEALQKAVALSLGKDA